MADTKVSALSAFTPIVSDLLYGVDDPAGTPVSGKMAISDLLALAGKSTFAAGTLTDSAPLTLTQTWNDAAEVFTGLKVVVTDTASAAASLILDLQAGGASRASFKKNGHMAVNRIYVGVSSDYSTGYIYSSGSGLYLAGTNGPVAEVRDNFGIHLGGQGLGWGTFGLAPDLILARDDAAVLAQRNGANAQTFRLYNTYTNASNYERMKFGWNTNVFEIKPENAGTGSARVVHISGLPTANPGAGILWNNAGTPAIGT